MESSRWQRSKNRRKVRFILSGIVLTALLVIGSSLALFSDRLTATVNGSVGKVDVEFAQGMTLSNATQIVPGDGIPNVNAKDSMTENFRKEIQNKDLMGGNDTDSFYNPVITNAEAHKLQFSIMNKGTEATDLRYTIYLSAKRTSGGFLQNASDVFFIYKNKLGDIPYLNEGAKPEVGKDYFTQTNIEGGKFLKAVVYESELLKGVNGNEVTQGSNAQISPSISLAMNRLATEDLDSVDIRITLLVEAKQHQNSDNGDWSVVSTESFKPTPN